jgi:hypothetical protein
VPFETAVEQWQAGVRRLEASPADERPTLERVTRHAELYDAGTGWVSDIAVAAAPEEPFAWDVRVVGDAAFHRYVREAADYAGGRRIA